MRGWLALVWVALVLASTSPVAARVADERDWARWAEAWRLVDQKRPAEASLLFQQALAWQGSTAAPARPRCKRARPFRFCLARR